VWGRSETWGEVLSFGRTVKLTDFGFVAEPPPFLSFMAEKSRCWLGGRGTAPALDGEAGSPGSGRPRRKGVVMLVSLIASKKRDGGGGGVFGDEGSARGGGFGGDCGVHSFRDNAMGWMLNFLRNW